MSAGLGLFLTLLVIIAAVLVRPVRHWFRTRRRPLRTVGVLGAAWLVLLVVLAIASPQPAPTPTAQQATTPPQQTATTSALPPAVATTAVPPTTGAMPTTSGEPTRDNQAPNAAPSEGTAGQCHAREENGQPLPDPACTPGVTNDAVTAATIGSTICRAGWTSTVRPPQSFTAALKRQQVTAYGYADGKLGDYEEDHLIPLELGGAPTDPRNLWPQPDNGVVPNPKDAVENALHRAVCAHRVELDAAQRAIATDWTTALAVLGLDSTTGARPAAPAPAPPPPPAPGGGGVYYKNCAAARAAHAAPLHRGDPGYRPELDRNGDGIACEK